MKISIIRRIASLYENWARVNTSFIASEGPAIRSAPDLFKIIEEANRVSSGKKKRGNAKYSYPVNLIKPTDLEYMSRHGITYKEDRVFYVKRLDDENFRGEFFGGAFIAPYSNAANAKEEAKITTESETIPLHFSDREIHICEKLEESDV